MIQSARFLLGRFRLDVWWYGVPLLLRGALELYCLLTSASHLHQGPLLALPVVFFSGHACVAGVLLPVHLDFLRVSSASQLAMESPNSQHR